MKTSVFERVRVLLAAVILTCGVQSTASAGPFLFAGTDSDDHGLASGGMNQDGWLFMQKAIENLAPGVTLPSKVVTILGSTSSAAAAATSAFNLSTLPGLGWVLETVAVANFATFFMGEVNNSGILMMDSGSTNIAGGVDGSAFVPYANAINNFLGLGGGLLSQGNGYDWVNALVPGLTVVDVGGGGVGTPVTLTAAGQAAFPGLTNQDLSTGPWHNYFLNFAPIPLLATAPDGNATRAIIIGSSGGTVTNPDPLPEPTTLLLVGLGVTMAAVRMRTRRRRA